jgi:ESS family glutamate:Na+ symporter
VVAPSAGLIGTTAFAAFTLFLGYRLRATVPALDRFNIPAPVIGGLLVAIVLTVLRANELPAVEFDTTLQQPLMIAFFTSLGFAASFRLLRAGGGQVLLLLAAASVFAVVQCIAGAAVAVLHGLPALVGPLTGAVSLSGGPATSLAFAPLFEQAGIANAAPIALATAMGGIVLGSLVGAPLVTLLIERHRLRPDGARATESPTAAPPPPIVPGTADESSTAAPGRPGLPSRDETYVALKSITLVLLAMWSGAQISAMIERAGVTMPGYIGAMLVAGVLRNLDDLTGWFRLPLRAIDTVGSVALAFFLAMALMNLDLLALASLAQPLVVNLAVQLALVTLVCIWPLHRLMGRDYDAAVMCGGFAGFMLGTTANAMAVMRSVTDRYGPAARAFLVAPLVGAFFLDFTNALIITLSVNLLD